jgi:DnaJ family protein C protein 28
MDDLHRLVEEKLREAIAAGEFDDLPGRGRPQDLRVNPHVHPDDRLAHDMLHAHGFGLPWIEERRDLLRQREQLLEELRRAWQRWGGGLPSAVERNARRARWMRALERMRADAAELNRRIAAHNHVVPVPGMRVAAVDIDAELGRLESAL